MFKITSVIRRSSVLTAHSRVRLIHASPAAYKTVTEKVTEVANKVNKSVGKGLADVIDKGEKVTYAAKDTVSSATRNTAKRAEKEAEDTSTAVKEKKRQAVGEEDDRERQ